jgi:hypothetical protein
LEGALNRLTHTLTKKKGVLLMRAMDGKLDNPYGAPACLMPNGQVIRALSGQRMDRKRYQTALARSEVARARTISREPPEVGFVVTKLT